MAGVSPAAKARPKLRSREHGAAVPLEEADRRLLNLMQSKFPLELRPYARVGELAGMSEEERMGSWHLAGPGGEVRSAGAAFEPLLRELPGGRPLSWLAARAPRLTERAYGFVSSNRTPIGKRISERAKVRADARIAERARG